MPLRSSLQNTAMSAGSASTSTSRVAVRRLKYDGLDDRAQEVLKRRPMRVNTPGLCALVKPQLQQFLKNNNHPFKAGDRKRELVEYVVDLISKTEPSTSTANADNEKCDIPDELTKDLPAESKKMLKDMQGRPRNELESLLLDFGGVVSDVQNKRELLCQLAELLSEQNRAQQGMLTRQLAAGNPGRQSTNNMECCVCMEKPLSAGFNPCGHAISCMNCAKQLEQCPVCRKKIESVLHLYFA